MSAIGAPDLALDPLDDRGDAWPTPMHIVASP